MEKTYWQSPGELAGEAEGPAPGPPGELPGGQRIFQAAAELAAGLAEGLDGTRRDFLRRMGFGLAAAAAASCSPIPERRALPLVEQPEGFLPGVASHYATACGGCAAGCGLLVKVRDGRPIKVEGNPGAPLPGGGGTCAAGQAAVLSLYDEGRLRGPLWLGRPASWEEVDARVGERLAAVAARGGRIVLLTGTPLGPASRALAAEWLARFPTARHVAYDPLSLSALRLASERSFGRPVVPRFRLDRARLVVGVEADFLGTWLSPVEHTRRYAEMRRPRGEPGAEEMGRHVQIESGLSLTGSNADLRFAVRPSELGLAALALLEGVARRAGAEAPAVTLPAHLDPQALDRVAAELWRLRGESLVVCGAGDLALQLVVHRINSLLGNVGRTLDLDNPSLQAPGDDRAVAALAGEMERGEVQALVVWGANPVYELPEGERFRRGLGRVALSVSFADRADETAAHVHAVCPDHHFLESWGDAEPARGRLLLRQPTIAPLFATRAAQDSLLRWLGREEDWHGYLQEHWRREVFPRQGRQESTAGFEAFWDRALEAGGIALPEAEARAWEDRADLGPATPEIVELVERARQGEAARRAGELEVHLYPTVALRDGRGANNPWLQELPDPVARTTWGNHAALAPALAARLGLADGDLASLVGAGTALELPVHVQPGLAPDVVAVALGYGRTRAGRVADGLGANAWPLLRREGASAMTVRLAPAGGRRELAQVQRHGSLEGRPIVRETTLAELRRPEGDGHGGERHDLPSLWPERPAEGPSWGLAIDLAACTGCAACVVACQAENNVPVVGPGEARRGREMHWLRIDRYYSGPPEAPEVVYQPMLCQHCGHAPCETVCPVLATVHSSDGLNQQVYNRCVGTRYCANNCPYKVRRFNWFDYADGRRFDYVAASELGRMVLNPDVVVRSRGVMEKCSLCIQRIQEGKLEAARGGVPLPPDGAIQTACQQACPAGAIVFGDRTDPESAVARRQGDPRAFRVLEELGTRPAVAYLAKVRNPL